MHEGLAEPQLKINIFNLFQIFTQIPSHIFVSIPRIEH
jgi:hypothetical protein